MPGTGLLSFANAHWLFSSLGACNFDAARLAAWRSAGLFQGGRAKAGTGRSGGRWASRERRRPRAAREPDGQQVLPRCERALGWPGRSPPEPEFIREIDHRALISDLGNKHPLGPSSATSRNSFCILMCLKKIFFRSNLKNFKLAEKLKRWNNEYSYTHYPECAIHISYGRI